MSEKQTEWMYTGSNKPDLEQYLLGRRIDDAVDPTQETNEPADWISGKVPEDGDIGARAEMWKTRDAFAKAREDPMFIIEKQKRSAHVDLKNNPLKMQKIKDLLANELKKDLKKKKKRKKSMEEDSHDRRDESSSSRHRSEVSDRHSKTHRSQNRRSSRSRSRSPKHSRRQRSRSPEKRRSRSPVKHRHRRNRSRSRSAERHDEKRHSRSQRSPEPTTSTSSPKPASSHKPAMSQKPAKSKYPIPRGGSGISKKMTAEELERKRAEMMNNASSRDVERKERYSKHKDTELADTAANKEGKAEFLHKFKVDSYSSSSTSVEERIKSGIFSKQRTKADLNTFLKK